MEGPSLVILKEELAKFRKKKVLRVSGNTKQPKEDLLGRTLQKVETFGKTIYLIFSGGIYTRTHFMLFGSYRIDGPKENRIPRIQLDFDNGAVSFYACAFSFVGKELFLSLDHRVDVLSDEWDEKHVTKLVKGSGNSYLCDVFLDQDLFAGSGNIVKNEVLFNLRRHPLTRLSDVDEKDFRKLVRAIRAYCEHFYEWKKRYELRKHWQVYKKRKCKVCQSALKREKTGKRVRSTFFCPVCQSKKHSKERITLHEVLPIKSGGPKEKRLDH